MHTQVFLQRRVVGPDGELISQGMAQAPHHRRTHSSPLSPSRRQSLKTGELNVQTSDPSALRRHRRRLSNVSRHCAGALSEESRVLDTRGRLRVASLCSSATAAHLSPCRGACSCLEVSVYSAVLTPKMPCRCRRRMSRWSHHLPLLCRGCQQPWCPARRHVSHLPGQASCRSASSRPVQYTHPGCAPARAASSALKRTWSGSLQALALYLLLCSHG